jgi:3-oxoadipate enol-lactonase
MPVFNCEGVDLYYEIHGDEKSKHTIAFFNGVMASVSSWYPMIPVFEKLGFKIILHDFKGQMKSGKPEKGYSFAQHSAEAKALFQHLSVEHLHLAGTSYGGEVAMKFAILYPEMTDSISIIDSVSELDEVLKGFVLSWKTLCDTGDGEAFFWGMAPSIYGPDFYQKNRDMLAGRAAATKEAPPEYFAGQKKLYDAFVEDVYMTNELGRISCPTLVICGEDDILKKPKFSKIIADSIAGSEYITIPNCGHVAIFEKTGELCSVILGFIMKHTAPPLPWGKQP